METIPGIEHVGSTSGLPDFPPADSRSSKMNFLQFKLNSNFGFTELRVFL